MWKPVESAPKDGSEILVWSARDGMFVAFWRGPRKAWLWTTRDMGGDEELTVTHWQPCPPEPDLDR